MSTVFVPRNAGTPLCRFHRSVIVAVIAVRVMQVTGDQIIGVIAVGHRLVSAARAVGMALRVRATAVRRRALRRIGDIYFDGALVDVVAMNAMQVTLVQVIAVVTMLNALVSTARFVNVLV